MFFLSVTSSSVEAQFQASVAQIAYLKELSGQIIAFLVNSYMKVFLVKKLNEEYERNKFDIKRLMRKIFKYSTNV